MNKCELVVGIAGGVAAYKSATLVSQLIQSGARVTVVMSRSAGRFVGEASFQALTGRAVVNDLFDRSYPLGAHIELSEKSKLLCVAPATANFLAKAATGLADDLLSTLYLTFTGPTVLVPAMNCEMWEKPAVQRNVATLRADGVHFVGPETGWLSCRRQGTGRMAEAETILRAITAILDRPCHES